MQGADLSTKGILISSTLNTHLFATDFREVLLNSILLFSKGMSYEIMIRFLYPIAYRQKQETFRVSARVGRACSIVYAPLALIECRDQTQIGRHFFLSSYPSYSSHSSGTPTCKVQHFTDTTRLTIRIAWGSHCVGGLHKDSHGARREATCQECSAPIPQSC